MMPAGRADLRKKEVVVVQWLSQKILFPKGIGYRKFVR